MNVLLEMAGVLDIFAKKFPYIFSDMVHQMPLFESLDTFSNFFFNKTQTNLFLIRFFFCSKRDRDLNYNIKEQKQD